MHSKSDIDFDIAAFSQYRRRAKMYFASMGCELRDDNKIYGNTGVAIAEYQGHRITDTEVQFLVKSYRPIKYIRVTVEVP